MAKAGTAATRQAFLPATPEAFAYDLDGNLTGDGRWLYTWDAENRLIAMETVGACLQAIPGFPGRRLEFNYDAAGRRIQKKVSNWSGSAYVLATDRRFLYDGWNMIAELDGLSGLAPVRTFAWGLDLSGSAQGAGGVGGLLAISAGTATYAAGYDGNGNVLTLIDAATGATAVDYEYGPFGEPLKATGVAAALNPFRFSTKYTDDESDLLYYGFRYYCPNTGRWLSRDPAEEEGGHNLYGFVANDAVNHFDLLGLKLKPFTGNQSSLQPNYVTTLNEGETPIRWPGWWIGMESDGSGVATVNDKTVAIDGQLSLGFNVRIGNDPNGHYPTDPSRTLQQHENQHYEMAKADWNRNVNIVNAWEGTYCSRECAELAAEIANLYNNWMFRQDQAAQAAWHLSIGIRRSLDVMEQSQGTTMAAAFHAKMMEKSREFYELGCTRPKQ
jgi:RHS repeat-associated protein